MAIGIISAMHEELAALLEAIQIEESHTIGQREYHLGRFNNQQVVAVFSRWGKVAAATTLTQMINSFNISEVIFTGVAGSIQNHVNIGDIVIAKHLCQHDMNAAPILPKYQIPLLAKTYFDTTENNRQVMVEAAQHFINERFSFVSESLFESFNIQQPKVHLGGIASGDQFIHQSQQVNRIQSELKQILCVEMEGAAVAQICYEYNIPFQVIRTISDKANDQANIDFPAFASQIASSYALGILSHYLT